MTPKNEANCEIFVPQKFPDVRYCKLYTCSVLPRNILRHVEVHATLSVHIIRDGCRKAQGKKVPKLLWVLDDLF